MEIVKFTDDESVNTFVSYSVYDFLSTHTRLSATTVDYEGNEKIVFRKHGSHISEMSHYHELYLKDLDDGVNNVTIVLTTFVRNIGNDPDMFSTLCDQTVTIDSVAEVVDELTTMFNRSLLRVEVRRRDLMNLAKIYNKY